MDLAERKLKILIMIVEMYVKTGEPVSSKAVCDALNFSISPATVRNEMANLVELGFLEQPHTSAGRIPSHLGYRIYINNINSDKLSPISHMEKEFINNSLFAAEYPEQVLEEASHILANLTKFVAVSTSPQGNRDTIKKIDFVQTGTRNGMMVIITSTGLIKNKLFKTEYDLNSEILRVFFAIINEQLREVEIAYITRKYIENISHSFGEVVTLLSPIFKCLLEALDEIMEAEINLEGQNNLLFLPNFTIEDARKVMEFLNRRDDIVNLILKNQNSKINVLIGGETKIPELKDSSIIISRYDFSGNESGAIAIIGPIRMNYKKAIKNLKYLTDRVENILSNILEDN